MKKVWIGILMFCVLIVSVFGSDLSPCTDNNDPTSVDVTLTTVNYGTDSEIQLSTDRKWYNLTSFTIDAQETFNITESVTVVNQSTVILDWKHVNPGEVYIHNTTHILNSGNYSIDYLGANITWNLTDIIWNGTAVYVEYNRTINTSENMVNYNTDGIANTAPYTTTGDTTYGGSPGFSVYDSALDGADWDVNYYYTTRTCTSRDSCLATQATTIAAFGLISLFAIVGAAMIIVSLASGDGNFASLSMFGISLIGLAVILFVGYYIIYEVGRFVCTV